MSGDTGQLVFRVAVFHRGRAIMLHPHTEVRFVNAEIGNGVFATRLIPKGTVVWALDRFDRLFTTAQVRRMEPVYQAILERYCFRNREGRWVFCWDNTRFTNHSFNPTNVTTPYDFELAIRDIRPGEQMTNDYGYFNIIEPFECLPEPGCDRTWVMPDDLLRYHALWDRQLAEAFLYFDKVEQPLLEIIKPEFRLKSQRIAQGLVPHDTILGCYYNPEGQNA